MQGIVPRRRWYVTLVASMIAAAGAGCAAPAAQTVPTPAALVASPTVARPAAPAAAATATALPALPTVTATAAPTVALPTAAPTAPPTAEPIAAAEQREIDPALAAELQRILDQIVGDGKITGAVLAVSIPGHQTWTGASGYMDRQRSQPIDPGTHMRIASVSKLFTAAVVMQLVEEGALDLDAPLSTWFPELVPDADTITVRRLLNHTTGLYDYLEDQEYLESALQAPEREWEPAELVAYAAKHPSAFRPGAPGAWDYSSTNYVILGMIVEEVTGNTLGYEMRQRIFTPLGLHDTFFVPEEEVRGVQARGYRQTRDVTGISLSFAFATANIVSTVADVERFGAALFGGELLAPETLAQMLAFQNGKGQYNMPALEYGLGVMRNDLFAGRAARGALQPASASTVLGHTGGFAGFRAALWHETETGVTIALGMNQGITDPNILASAVLDAVLDAEQR